MFVRGIKFRLEIENQSIKYQLEETKLSYEGLSNSKVSFLNVDFII